MSSRLPEHESWLLPEWPEAPAQLRALTTRRAGGVSRDAYASFNLAEHVGEDPSAVRANRQILRERAALPTEPLWLEQVHGTGVVEYADSVPVVPPRADAAITFAPGRVCAVLTADCLPVVLVDRSGARVGVAHAGWRGLVAGVLEATVHALGIPARNVLAWLGPAISQSAFEVGGEVRDAFLRKHAGHGSAFVPNATGRYQADLYALARQTLERIGVANVRGGGRCTFAEREEFYSYRRDGGRTGRMATLAWLEP